MGNIIPMTRATMKNVLRIFIVLSIAASSILFAAPSFAVSVNGVNVTVGGNTTIFSSTSNKVIFSGFSSSANDKITVDFGGLGFAIANINELSWGGSNLGIPSTPETGFDKTINMIAGYGYCGRLDVYSGVSVIFQNFFPSGANNTCSQGLNRSFNPFIQFNFSISTGIVSMRVPVTTTTSSNFTINSNGSYSLSSGSVSSWVEIANVVSTTAPGTPTAVSATSTGATTADVTFTAPASNGGATIISYTATSSPGGITGTISQAGSGTIHMTGLTAGTAYTFTVKATNSVGDSVASSPSNSTTTVGVPTGPTAVIATATGKRSATVSFAAPASNGGSAVTSYTATSTPSGITQTLTQSGAGTFTLDGLKPGTAYTFAVTATNAIGTSVATISNSVTTTPLVVASLSSLSFIEDGTGTGGRLIWEGKNIDAVLFTGPTSAYPGPYNYGAFTRSWNGRIRNLTPDTSYTVSIYAISEDGVGDSKSLTFKTSSILPALVEAVSLTTSSSDQMATQLPKLFSWINENVFVDGEGDRMKTALNKFNAIKVLSASAYLRLPSSSVLKVSAVSSTPIVCVVEGQLTVRSIAVGTCTISYTISGPSKAPVTLVRDFKFTRFVS